MGELVSIVIKPVNAEPAVGRYTRQPVEAAELVAGYGIEGDAKGGAAGRHLNIMSGETVSALSSDGFRATPGELGEQLVMSGIDVESLPPGSLLCVGASARIRLTKPRTPCERFERYQGRPREEAVGRIGSMAEVVAGGTIRVGDVVEVAPDA